MTEMFYRIILLNMYLDNKWRNKTFFRFPKVTNECNELWIHLVLCLKVHETENSTHFQKIQANKRSTSFYPVEHLHMQQLQTSQFNSSYTSFQPSKNYKVISIHVLNCVSEIPKCSKKRKLSKITSHFLMKEEIESYFFRKQKTQV